MLAWWESFSSLRVKSFVYVDMNTEMSGDCTSFTFSAKWLLFICEVRFHLKLWHGIKVNKLVKGLNRFSFTELDKIG